MSQLNHYGAIFIGMSLIIYAFALIILGPASANKVVGSLLWATIHRLLKLFALAMGKLTGLLYYIVKVLLKGLWWIFLHLRVKRSIS